MGDWDMTVLSGPEASWRVPVSELENRLERLARALRVAASAWCIDSTSC